MKLLMISPTLPWPRNTGSRQRTYALLAALARKHAVTLSVGCALPEEAESLTALAGLVEEVIVVARDARQWRHVPMDGSRWRMLRDFSRDMVRTSVPYHCRLTNSMWSDRLRGELNRFDGVVCRYALTMEPVRGFPLDRVVLDADDLGYRGLIQTAARRTHGYGSALFAVEAARAYMHEQRLFRRVAHTVVCSEGDLKRVKSPRKSIVANGVDLPDRALVEREPAPSTLVYVATFGYEPNRDGLRWFLDAVWPLVLREVDTAKLQVVGINADAKHLPFAGRPGVELIGPVASTLEWVAGATLTIVPLLFGLGTRIKIAESLACGRPVVSTPIGAEGYDDLSERDGLLRAGEPQAMAAAICRLLKNRDQARGLGRAGRLVAERRFSWESITATFADNVERWIAERSRSPGGSALKRCPSSELNCF